METNTTPTKETPAGSADEIEVEMANESNTNRKFVTTASGKYEIMVQDKKGFFSSAIPARLPCCLAVFCCFMNCVLPGVGTLISAPFSLCEDKEQKTRTRNFCVNMLAAFLQMALALILIGWFWSILWAIEFLKPLKGDGFEDS